MSTATTMNTSSEPKFQKTLQIKVQNPIRSHLKLLTNTKTFIVNYFPLDSEKIQISADLSSTLTVARAIASFIRAINEILPAKSFPLKIETKNYALHFCKKNGIAKEDLPGML